MSKGLVRRAAGWAAMLSAITLATPRRASAYVDPGSGAMLWQVAAAACIGSLFYLRRVTLWVRRYAGFRSPRALGFIFATAYALVVSPVVCSLCRDRQLPRFGDAFLLGIVLTVYLFTWEGAAYLTVVALLVSAWVLPPYGTFALHGIADWYRLISLGLVSLFLIFLINHLKARRRSANPQRSSAMADRGVAVGTD